MGLILNVIASDQSECEAIQIFGVMRVWCQATIESRRRTRVKFKESKLANASLRWRL
jgi:hypothetical protein